MAKKKHIGQRCWKCDREMNGVFVYIVRVSTENGDEEHVVHSSCGDSMTKSGAAVLVTCVRTADSQRTTQSTEKGPCQR